MTGKLVVPQGLTRTAQPNDQRWTESAIACLTAVARELDRTDLDGVSLLDLGCGTKFTKAFVDLDLPIGRYAGVDTSAAVVKFLQENVTDPRLSFHHMDAYNEMYNASGTRMRDIDRLPIGDSDPFEAISLFSVFTHLNPVDLTEMLRLAHSHANDRTILVGSCYLAESGGTGHGLVDDYVRWIRSEPDSSFGRVMLQRLFGDVDAVLNEPASAVAVHPFIDLQPRKPLKIAAYSRVHMIELVDASDWDLVAIRPPSLDYQHLLVLRPS